MNLPTGRNTLKDIALPATAERPEFHIYSSISVDASTPACLGSLETEYAFLASGTIMFHSLVKPLRKGDI